MIAVTQSGQIVTITSVDLGSLVLTKSEIRDIINLLKDFAEIAEWEYPSQCPKLQSKAHTLLGRSTR